MLIALIIPSIVIILDKKDYRHARESAKRKENAHLIEKLAQLSKKSVNYW